MPVDSKNPYVVSSIREGCWTNIEDGCVLGLDVFRKLVGLCLSVLHDKANLLDMHKSRAIGTERLSNVRRTLDTPITALERPSRYA